MYTVTETPLFQRLVVAVWTDEERNEFIGWLSSNPLAGDVIPAAGGLRKVRWSRAGMGKRGGARVIYFNHLGRSLSDLGIVGYKSTAAVHFSPSF